MRVIGNKVLVKKLDPQSKTIILAESATKVRRGKVIQVGNGVYYDGHLVPLEVIAGDTIQFPNTSGIDVNLNGVDYILITEEHILVIE